MTTIVNELATPKSLVEELDRVTARVQIAIEYKQALTGLIPFAALIHSKTPPNYRAYWVATSYEETITLMLFLNVKGFTITAAPELVEFLEFLSDYYIAPPKSEDEPQYGSRSYIFKPEPGEYNLTVQVKAELDSNSENCQRIITGTQKTSKMVWVEVEEPIYQFKC